MTSRRFPVALLLLVAPACAAEIGEPEDAELEVAEAMSYNAMSYNAMSYNALSASFDANAVMTTVPLRTESYDPVTGHPALVFALHDSLTRDFFKYLVGCALAPGQGVVYKDPFTSINYKWVGSMGYCAEWGQPGGSADAACRQVVSACLLSRVNAFGQSVRLSHHGHYTSGAAPQPIHLSDVVPAGDTYLNGALVPGIWKKCFPGVTGEARECAWRPGETGYCNPGSTLTVGMGAPPAANCAEPRIGESFGADTMMRVCRGIIGCKQTDSTFLAQANNTCGMLAPSVTFTCPASGFFTTMIGHHIAGSTPAAPPWKEEVAGAGLLGTEKEIFAYQEAAFFGDVFNPAALHPRVNIFVDPNGEVHGRSEVLNKPVKGSVYRTMFACWSPTWTKGMAYATHRVCGGPTLQDCSAIPIGACANSNTPDPPPPSVPYPTYVCAEKDDPLVPGDDDFQFCYDKSGNRWDHAMTVFLNNPCDLFPNPNICENIYGKLPDNW